MAPKNIEEDLNKIKFDSDTKPFKPKGKYPGFSLNFYDYFTEYSDYTGIHGFKYMGEQNRTIIEKLWWLILFCISLYFCIYLIIETWVKWDQSPVLVSFAQSPTPIWQIPFPAITICSESKALQRQFNYTDVYNKYVDIKKGLEVNITEEEKKRFSDISLICDNHLYREGNKTAEFDTIKYLMDIAPQFEEVFGTCEWTSKKESCKRLFSPMLTEDGMCFTFNMLDKSEVFTNAVYLHGDYMSSEHRADEWNIETGYAKTAGKDTFPRRAMSVGADAGLFLSLRAYQQDLDYICRGPVQGFKVALHHPGEIPRVSTKYFRAPLNQEVIVAIKPEMMTTSDGLKGYDPIRRQCFFPGEKPLQFFESYTQENCQVECLTNFTLKKCDCVAYHMPHEESTKICGSGSIECMVDAKDELLTLEVEAGISSSKEDESEKKNQQCNCLPACTSLTYNAETSQADFNWPMYFQALRTNMSEFPGIQMTRIAIFFKEMQFITSQRNELFGQTDFLANCGGLLGLFTGFSFLSVFEILYFLTLRLMCNIKKYGVHYWSASENLLNNDAYLHNY